MSEEPPAQQDLPDDSEPTPERQAELRAAYEANVAAGREPYRGTRIFTRGEVLWILREHDWHGEYAAGGKPRPNFVGASFREANLAGLSLCQANLVEATFRLANLAGVHFEQANLAGARFNRTVLAGAVLDECNLDGARLARTVLTGAHLAGARMSGATILADIVLDHATVLGDVAWNGASLVRVDWESARTLGDEAAIAKVKGGRDKVVAYRYAARAYRGLALALRQQGLLAQASHYRLREQRLERRVYLLTLRPFAWLGSLLLDWVAGYGERPVRAFRAYALVVLVFAVLYFAITNYGGQVLISGSQPLKWYEALVLSLSSFHGRGFFPQMISLGDPVAVVAASEAVIGLFIELVFISTFTRRFLGN